MWHEWSPMKKLIWLRRVTSGMSYILKTVTGAIVHIMDAVAGPIDALSVAVEPVQNLNGYDNPWPAGGGVNKLPIPDWFEAGYTQTIDGVTMTVNADGSLTFVGTPTAQADFWLSNKSATPPVNPFTVNAGTYTISQSGLPVGVKFVTSGGGGNGFPYTELTSANTSATGTVTDGTIPFNYFLIRIPANTSSNGTYKIQLELGSTATAYSPYSNICPITGWDSVNIWVQATHDTTATPNATIQLGETVYGGTLDVVNGKMTVDRVGITPTIDLLQSINTYGIANFRFGLSDASTKAADQAKAICSTLKYQKTLIADTTEPGFILSSASMGYLRIPQEIANTKETAQSWVSTNNVIVVYYLATPFELTLTPEQISTLQGTNNVWSDAGDVTVTYRASAS